MNRPQRIRRVYAELQRTVGDLATGPELLQAAADLVELVNPSRADDSRFSLRTGGLPFEQWSLDVAMADGGWRVMSRESEVVRNLFEDERDGISNEIEVEHWLMEHAA
jgi:hypothetical protein